MVVGLWVTWKILYRNNDTSLERKQTGKERWVAFKKAFWPLLLPIIIIVGLRGGILLQQKRELLLQFMLA